jgi:GxxExxY protein
VLYKGARVETGYRIDLLVEKSLIVEIKAIEQVLPIHAAQLLTYLKLSGLRVGLLINFNVTLLKNGITRLVSGPQ